MPEFPTSEEKEEHKQEVLKRLDAEEKILCVSEMELRRLHELETAESDCSSDVPAVVFLLLGSQSESFERVADGCPIIWSTAGVCLR